jgi:exopolysaccharide biosynthesis predicted pyruvyltransferase EpsI
MKSSMSPFDSHPPKFVEFNVTGNIRHACLHEIRNSRHSFYYSYIEDAHHILLVDPAYHSNVGDHMITIAELTLLQRRSRTATSLSQCSYVQAHDFVPSCNTILQQEVNYPDQIVQTYNSSSSSSPYMNGSSYKKKVALWHGGGNFGNLWSTAQQARIQSIHLLLQANYSIIGMPNSWFYTNEQIESMDVKQLRYNIIIGLGLSATNVDTITDIQLSNAVNSRIIWTWREHYSYVRAMRLLPYCTHQLVPDIAFQLGPYVPVRSIPDAMNGLGMLDIVFLLRNDHESIFASARNRRSIQSMLNNIPGASQLSFSIVDWDDRLLRFQPNSPNDVYFTDTAIQLLSMGNILICDRLHI